MKLRKILLSTVVTTALVFGATAQKDIVVAPVIAETVKEISLIESFKPSKDSFRVSEEITFDIKTSKDAYLYIVAQSQRSDKSYLILPNKYQSENKFQNILNQIPQKGSRYKFISDAKGVEKVFLVASTTKLPFKVDEYFKDTKSVYRVAKRDVAESFVKDIQVVEVAQNMQIEIQSLDININGEGYQTTYYPTYDRDAKLFFSTGKDNYKLGEKIELKYLTNRDGFVYIYVKNPNGELKELHKERVKNSKGYTLDLTSHFPTGEHQIIGLFSDKEIQQGNQYAKDIVVVSTEENIQNAPIVNRDTIIIE